MAMHSHLLTLSVVLAMVLGGFIYPAHQSGADSRGIPLVRVPYAEPFSATLPIPTMLAPSTSHSVGEVPVSLPIEISLTLSGKGASGLQASLPDHNAQGTSLHLQPLGPTEYAQEFGPDPVLVSELTTYLGTHGLASTRIGNLLLASGTVGDVERAFSVKLLIYSSGNQTAWAPSTRMVLPAALAPIVGSVMGVNTFVKPVTHMSFPSLATPALPRPAVTNLVVKLTPPSFSFVYNGATYITPPTGIPVTFGASTTLPANDSCPCYFHWDFGDGNNTFVQRMPSGTGAISESVVHTYRQAFNQFSLAAQALVLVNDSQKNSGQASDQVIPTLSPGWMEKAYGENPLFAQGYSGQKMTIGLDEMCDSSFEASGTTSYTTAISTFSSAMGLPVPTTSTLSYIGPGSTACSGGISGWSQETVLDMDWAHAMAPNASIQVYFGANSQGTDITGGDATWANSANGVFLASNSWGLSEPQILTAPGVAGPFDSTWDQAATEGVTLFSSSGDCGGTSNNTQAGQPPVSRGLNVSYPDSIPTGVGVGGTIVQTDKTGNWTNEYVWNGTAYNPASACNNGWGTGGGWSRYYSIPPYQGNMTGPGWKPPAPPKWQVKNPRGVPDVAMDAATWVDIYYPGYGWLPTGGTSLASPMFAATMSVVLGAMNRNYNSAPPAFLNYPIYSIGKTASYATSFHDVTMGNNNDPVGYSAAAGWDPTTGWGTPNATGLVKGLISALPLRFNVSGFVLSATGPLAGATVSDGAGISTTTSASGAYYLWLTNGTYTLRATAKGYNNNTLAVAVNGAPMSDQNITITSIASKGRAQVVSGELQTETHVPLIGGLIRVTGAVQASAYSGSGGTFTLYLLNGTYNLTGNYTVTNTVYDPTFQTATQTLAVNGPTTVVVYLHYIRHTLAGFVLDSSSNLAISGAFVNGYDLVSFNATTSPSGAFTMYLPTGTATITASATGYISATMGVFVNVNNTATATVYLLRSSAKPTEILLGMRVVAPLNASLGIPQAKGNTTVAVEVWANNSMTGSPFSGVSLTFSSNVSGGSFSRSTLVVPASGLATTQFTPPFVTYGTRDHLVASVTSSGYTGNNATYLWVTSDTAGCSSSCLFPVTGSVLAANGAPIAGATLTLFDSTGTTSMGTAISGAQGVFTFTAKVGSYVLSATAPGFVTGTIPFAVKSSAVSLSPLVLNPVPQSAWSGQIFINMYIVIGPVVAGAMLAIAAILLLNRRRKVALEKEVKGDVVSTTPAQPIDAEAVMLPNVPALPEPLSPQSPPISESPRLDPPAGTQNPPPPVDEQGK